MMSNDFIEINRKVYSDVQFREEFPEMSTYGYRFAFFEFLWEYYHTNLAPSGKCLKLSILKRLPFIQTINHYKLNYLIHDFVTGFEIGIMHIPYGLCYALIANVSPIYGMYTSFFPVLIYFIFGTSRHLSLGTSSLIALMVSQVFIKFESLNYIPITAHQNNTVNISASFEDTTQYLSYDRQYAKLLVMISCTFWVGIIQVVMFIFRLGLVGIFLSEALIKGFILGTSLHVLTSQLGNLFGIHLNHHYGLFELPKAWIELFTRIDQTNLVTFLISLGSISLLIAVNLFVNYNLKRAKGILHVPIELILLVIATVISHFSITGSKDLIDKVSVVDLGFLPPQVPPVILIKDMFFECLLIALLSFLYNFSVADYFSKYHRYEISANQELLAYGLSNILSSFFHCFASGASSSRTNIQSQFGGRTQVVSIFSSIVILLVLLFILSLFKDLPIACLSSIIVVKNGKTLRKLRYLKYYWNTNKNEFFQLLITLLGVIFLNIGIGLGVGISFYFFAHLVRSTTSRYCLLGNIEGTEFYRDIKIYKDAKPLKDIKIIRIEQELHGSNATRFKHIVYKLSGVKPTIILNKISQNKFENHNNFKAAMNLTGKNRLEVNKTASIKVKSVKTLNTSLKKYTKHLSSKSNRISFMDIYEKKEEAIDTLGDINYVDSNLNIVRLPFKYLIIDCSPINFIDTTGVRILRQLIKDYGEIGIRVYLAQCNNQLIYRIKMMQQAESLTHMNENRAEEFFDFNCVYITVHDAVIHASNQMKFEGILNTTYL